MRWGFFALVSIALAGSVVGLVGLYVHDARPTKKAMEWLPAPWGIAGRGEARRDAVAARDRLAHGTPDARAAAPGDEVDLYFAHRFPTGLRRDLEAACPAPARHLVVACFASIHQMLAKRGTEVLSRQRGYLWVLQASRVVWALAGLLAFWMLIRAYDTMRRADRRQSRPHHDAS